MNYSKALDRYYTAKALPIIHLVREDGSRNEDGYRVIREIVSKRADLSLFAPPSESHPGALDYLIEMTAGSLRDLFRAIIDSQNRAVTRINALGILPGDRNGQDKILWEDADKAGLDDLRQQLATKIDKDYYELLSRIRPERSLFIEEREKLVYLLTEGVLLDHNGWFSVHPIIQEELRKLGELTDG